MPKVAFLTHGDRRWGAGHLHRVSWIAEALLAQGRSELAVEINCPATPEAREFWQRRNLPVSYFSPGVGADARHSALYSVQSWSTIDTVVVDWLNTEPALIAQLRRRDAAIVLLDEYGPAQTDADVVINSLLAPLESRQSTVGLAQVYSGADYIQLSPALRKMRGVAMATVQAMDTELRGPTSVPGPVRAIMVSFGGQPRPDLANLALTALQRTGYGGRVIVMPAPEHTPAFLGLDIEWNPAGPDFHPYLAASDLAIVGGGLTLYEAAFLGVPAVSLGVSTTTPGFEQHQADSARKLAAAGCCRALGMASEVTAEDLAAVMSELISNDAARTRMSQAGMQLLDGRGLQRTVNLILDTLDAT